ncbi:hypothetical protein CABS01_08591 [Colletotrichum abscissum]|uniref:uncharacterized protein n=1 Tax=Colletotrichum abscissum TaxID=1671311 RepID=UPI0027D4CD20|nr:uncharacterized protein CABS01_08591 [Colletotrichum abscissum]KAK1507411.1 hypothetical protein CABS01_08591 [Colletotrichum abscissum]
MPERLLAAAMTFRFLYVGSLCFHICSLPLAVSHSSTLNMPTYSTRFLSRTRPYDVVCLRKRTARVRVGVLGPAAVRPLDDLSWKWSKQA